MKKHKNRIDRSPADWWINAAIPAVYEKMSKNLLSAATDAVKNKVYYRNWMNAAEEAYLSAVNDRSRK